MLPSLFPLFLLVDASNKLLLSTLFLQDFTIDVCLCFVFSALVSLAADKTFSLYVNGS
jgi:hypothetical protein